MSSQTSSSQASPGRPRFEVEIYAHALKARLELASFKAINGLGKTKIDDLEKSADLAASARAVAPSPWQPPRPVLADKSPVPSPMQSPSAILVDPSSARRATSTQSGQASTTASSSSTLMTSAAAPRSPSATSASSKPQRSIYTDIFGKEFGLSSRSAATSPTKASSSRPTDASPGRRRTKTQNSPASSTRYTGTSSLLDKAASSPQLGSPERKNGKFDWHNNPSAEMKAHEQELASSGHHFEVPTISPTKRVRLTSAAGALLASPRRARMHSNGANQVQSFLPNGHPASSLAQGLGISAPRTPRSRHNSAFGREVVPNSTPGHHMDQDQEERDRVASTLAMMAEDRAAARRSEHGSGTSSGGGNTSSGGEKSNPDTNGLRSAMPQTPRKIGFADPGSITPARTSGHRGHRRNVSWASLGDSSHTSQHRSDVASSSRPKTPERHINDDDEGAAHYLLYLASSPSPAGASRSTARFEGATPSLLPLRVSDDAPRSGLSRGGSTVGSGNEASDQESPSAAAKRKRETERSLPITPPPSGRARHQRNPLKPLDGHIPDGDGQAYTVAEVRASHFGSPPSTPPRQLARLPPQDFAPVPVVGTGEGYGWSTDAPKTPPPLAQPHTPQAPGSDFSYADFVNVSPSPKPRSIRRTPGTGGRGWTDAYGLGVAPLSGSGADRTPSRGTSSRAKFLDFDEARQGTAPDWTSEQWETTLTPGPGPPRLHSRSSSTASTGKDGLGSARTLDFQ